MRPARAPERRGVVNEGEAGFEVGGEGEGVDIAW